MACHVCHFPAYDIRGQIAGFVKLAKLILDVAWRLLAATLAPTSRCELSDSSHSPGPLNPQISQSWPCRSSSTCNCSCHFKGLWGLGGCRIMPGRGPGSLPCWTPATTCDGSQAASGRGAGTGDLESHQQATLMARKNLGKNDDRGNIQHIAGQKAC